MGCGCESAIDCLVCRKSFASVKVLKMHTSRKHGLELNL